MLIPNSGYKTFLQVSRVRYSGLALSRVSHRHIKFQKWLKSNG
ncbi:hypothetical protein [Candidatus Arsenophonus triatominarum]|nr:hypothetical protein [Candidatus Arsenophonus triatominarum]